MTNSRPAQLLFVYNANSDMTSRLFDVAHKLLSPATYQCSLCALTHGSFTENKLWREFRESASVTFTFLHKDEFERDYPPAKAYPVVFRHDSQLTELMSAQRLQQLDSIEDLINQLKRFIF